MLVPVTISTIPLNDLYGVMIRLQTERRGYWISLGFAAYTWISFA